MTGQPAAPDTPAPSDEATVRSDPAAGAAELRALKYQRRAFRLMLPAYADWNFEELGDSRRAFDYEITVLQDIVDRAQSLMTSLRAARVP